MRTTTDTLPASSFSLGMELDLVLDLRMTLSVCRRRSKRTEEKATRGKKKPAAAPSDAGKRGQKCVIL